MTRADIVVRFMSGIYGFTPEQAGLIADWVIADRKRIVEPLVKYKNKYSYRWVRVGTDKLIDETLTLAGVK